MKNAHPHANSTANRPRPSVTHATSCLPCSAQRTVNEGCGWRFMNPESLRRRTRYLPAARARWLDISASNCKPAKRTDILRRACHPRTIDVEPEEADRHRSKLDRTSIYRPPVLACTSLHVRSASASSASLRCTEQAAFESAAPRSVGARDRSSRRDAFDSKATSCPCCALKAPPDRRK